MNSRVSNSYQVFSLAALFAQLVGVLDARGENGEAALPAAVTQENFDALKSQSPFLREIGLSKSLIVTGLAHIKDDVYATLFDTETRESYLVGEEVTAAGMQLVSITGDESDLETLTARIKTAGSQVVSIRYEKLPAKAFKRTGAPVVRDIPNAKGTGPHGGPDPRVLTPVQMADAKKGAANYKEGFEADGYPKAPPAATVAKLQKLSSQQREAINVKMYEYRNKGLGLPERAKIYEGMLDRAVRSKK
ncbi:MAG: hypothetical protein ACKVJU_21080 [Verrucomicrobiales bacterium]|nr:hypothetical protein [Verrucomicrobiales bacterium]